MVRVPGEQDEDDRQLHRELLTLGKEQTQHINRIRGLLASCGLDLPEGEKVRPALEKLRTWDGRPLPAQMHRRLKRECERLELVQLQISELERERLQVTRQSTCPKSAQVRKLMALRAIGINSAWLYVHEVFGWRKVENRRQLASLCGLTPTP